MDTPQIAEKSFGTAPRPGVGPTPSYVKEPGGAEEHAEHARGFEWVDLARISFVALAAAAVWFHLWEPISQISVISIVAMLVGGYPIFKEAVENIINER